MPNLSAAFNGFNTGDIIRTGGPDRRHMTMFIKGADHPQSLTGFVHASDTVIFEAKERFNQTGTNIAPPYEYYACPNAELGRKAATLGRGWVNTIYGSHPDPKNHGSNQKAAQVSRFGAMVTTATLTAIPFELNALIRVIKWVAKAEQGALLSENRGTTCAAFVAACYQTAAMSQYLEDKGLLWNIKEGYKLLQSIVETKGEARERRTTLAPVMVATKGNKNEVQKPSDPHLYKGYASREHSNKQLKDNSWTGSVNDQWKKFYREFDKISNFTETGSDPDKNINQIIPAGFFFDIKYINAPLLSSSLDGAWTHRPYDKF